MPGMDITAAARRVGAIAWTEQRLFEVVGGWVASTPEPDAKLLFARLSRHHGDHAVALESVLPATRDHDPVALVAPLGDEGDEGAAALGGAADTPARVEALLVTLSRQRAAIEGFLTEASPIRDGPARRVAGLVLEADAALAEEVDAWRRGNR